MRSFLLIALCIVLPLCAAGQYNYFNDTQGDIGDLNSELMTNIELLDDEYYTWGGGIVEGYTTLITKKLTALGESIDERGYLFLDESNFSGSVTSFQRVPETNTFLMSQGALTSEGTQGVLMLFDNELDTIWKRLYSIYDDYTYFYTHAWDGDGFVLAGEYGLGPGQRGTFIAKVDEEGELLWNEVIHQPNEGAFRNRNIIPVSGGYLMVGGVGGGADTSGLIELLTENGDILWSVENQAGGGSFVGSRLGDEIIILQGYEYADYEFSTNPSLNYSYLRLARLDTATGELSDVTDIDVGEPWVSNGGNKAIRGTDGGYIASGTFLKPVDEVLHLNSYILKVDDDFQLEWYTELYYEDCFGCTNELFDLERAPDGGYVMVGKVDNPEDPRDRSWIVKVDACGDLEYNGCAPVGLSELEHGPKVTIYPNPASEYISISIDDDSALTRVALCDLAGREILSTSDVTRLEVSTVSTGVYVLQLLHEGELVHSERVVVR